MALLSIYNFATNSFDICMQSICDWSEVGGDERQVRFDTTLGRGTLRAVPCEHSDAWNVFITMEPSTGESWSEQAITIHRDECYHMVIANDHTYGGTIFSVEHLRRLQPNILLGWLFPNAVIFPERDLFWDEVARIYVTHTYRNFKWAFLGESMVAISAHAGYADIHDLVAFCKYLYLNQDATFTQCFERPFSHQFRYFMDQFAPGVIATMEKKENM